MNPLSSFSRPCGGPRPCLRLAAGSRQRRWALLGAFGGAAAAGLSLSAAGGHGSWPSLAAAGLMPRGLGRGGGSGGGGGPAYGEFGSPERRVTDVLLVVNAITFGVQMLGPQNMLVLWGAKINPLIVAGQWWRLLTPAFLHGNLYHLAVNSYSLNNLGPSVEATAGHTRFALMYLAGAVAGNVASFFGSPNISLGASGAIFGVGGALAVYFWRNKEVYGRKSDMMLQALWRTLVVNIFYGLVSPSIDNWGHMGGLAGGALMALLLGPCWRRRRLEGKRGEWLVDTAPLPWLRFNPRQLR